MNLFRIGIGSELAYDCDLMKLSALLFTSWLPLALLAEGGSTADDPFGAYSRAVDHQLSAILEHDQSPVQGRMRESTSVVQQAVISDDNKETNISAFAHRFWGGREDQLVAALDRLERLRPTLEPILESEGVPKQFVAVVLIESGAQPMVLSPRQARGLWQFIPETARQYGLLVSQGRDERIYLEASTKAAARYLRDLHTRFGDWPLALAAYNAGERSVEAALARGKAATFWQLSGEGLLPQETRNYVPAVLAAGKLLGREPSLNPIPIHGEPRWVFAFATVGN